MIPVVFERPLSRFPSLFDDLFRDEWVGRSVAPVQRGDASSWAPAVNIKENEKAFVVTADLPGVNKEDVKVHVDRGVLTLSAETRAEDRRDGETWHLTERRHGQFMRSFRLPDTVNATAIDAQFKNGVLELTLPKGPNAAARQIEVRA